MVLIDDIISFFDFTFTYLFGLYIGGNQQSNRLIKYQLYRFG